VSAAVRGAPGPVALAPGAPAPLAAGGRVRGGTRRPAPAAEAPGTVRVDEAGRTWIAGIGEPLPADERLLWAGTPRRGALARRVCQLRLFAGYFAALAAVVFWVQAGSLGARVAAVNTLAVVGMGVTVLAFGWVFATLVARSTVYAITDRRVVLRIGVAIPAVLNVPLDQIAAVDLRRDTGGTGDVVLTLAGTDRIAYLLLWPHARPWRYARPQPALRCVPDAEGVGLALARAVQAAELASHEADDVAVGARAEEMDEDATTAAPTGAVASVA
jgi:hypothetical protein